MLQIFIAFIAGVLTVAAPCILPLLPILLGASIGHSSRTRPIFIVLGFVLIFSAVGILISVLAERVGLNANIFRDIAIVVLACFGVLMIWPLPFEKFMERFSGVIGTAGQVGSTTGSGNLGGFILGMTLGLVWTPCAGPVLGSILTIVASQRNLATAVILLAAYAAGAGVPMLVIAYGGQYVTSKVRSLARYTRVAQQAFGVLIVLLAIAIYLNYDTQIYALILAHYNMPSINF